MSTEPVKTEYKNTICLPKTDFPMRANLNQREPEIMARWRERGVQDELNARPDTNGEFTLHDGPPYANGNIHLGHALNKVLKDMVVRYHTMLGKRAIYVPGWDCHGLPIEQKVSEKLGAKRRELSAVKVRQLCEEYARKWIDTQREEFLRLGIGGMWDKPYLTLDPQVEVGILQALRELVAGGYIYKGLKPVLWDIHHQTALADAEIEYDDVSDPAIYVKFPLLPTQDDATGALKALDGLDNASIVIWTTTPWTLPANVAVSLHPDFPYVALRVEARHGDATRTEHYIVARDLADAFIKDAGITGAEVVREIASRHLEHARLAHPVQPGATSVVVLGTHVTLEAGTGAVHTAPGHGIEDFIVGQAYKLPVVMPVDEFGKFTNEFSLMEGMTVWEANEPIIRILDEKDILVSRRDIMHSYPHSWRGHTKVIYRATQQWFMRVDHNDLRTNAKVAIDNDVKWIPGWGRDRIFNMVDARPDWCLSRQRAWGVPIPAIICKDSGQAILDPAILDRVIEVVRTRGTNAWFEDPVESFLPEGYVSPYGGGTNFEKETDILDVWFDSGSTHIAVLEARDELKSPADLYLEGSDQHRGWFQSSLLVSMGTRQRAPYRAVLTHGFLLDGKGEAMSKSKGNIIPPQDIIKKFGADVLRLWVASEDYRNDMKLSDEILDRIGEAYRRVRNTLRYLLGNLSDFNPATDTLPYAELSEIDKYVLHELNELVSAVRKSYDEYEFHRIFHRVNQFCVVTLSSLYIDVLKDRMYCSGGPSPLRRSAQTAQYEVAQALLRLLAPILVFTTDEAFSYLQPGNKSIHLERLPDVRPEWSQPELAADWQSLQGVRTDVMKALEDARQVKKAIGQSLEARAVLRPRNPDALKVLTPREGALAELLITSQAEVVTEAPANAAEAISVLEGESVHVWVFPANGSKCQRCWRILPDVGQEVDYPETCGRCADVLRRHW